MHQTSQEFDDDYALNEKEINDDHTIEEEPRENKQKDKNWKKKFKG
jgi:hypothetical protein